MTIQAFQKQMDRLSGLKFAPLNLDTHWEALSDLDAMELDAAIGKAVKNCEDFPSPKMLRSFVDEYRRDLPIPEEDPSREHTAEPRTITTPYGDTHTFTREWQYYCEDCSDTGRRSYWCADKPSKRFPWMTVVRCNTPKCRRILQGMEYEHEWVDACQCAATNPDVLRKKAQALQVTRKQAER